jgi:Protein of unknown function (DUF3341)
LLPHFLIYPEVFNLLKEEFMNENKVVMGLFKSRSALESAVDSLKADGFRNSDISALLPSNETTKDLKHVNTSKMPEGAAVGGATGAVLGGALGWLVGIGSLAIPGVGPLLAAGPLVASLAGAGLGSAAGGMTGALVGAGLPEFEAKRYEGYVRDGGYLMSVHCDNDSWAERAHTIFESCGAESVSTVGESKASSSDVVNEDIPRPMTSNL